MRSVDLHGKILGSNLVVGVWVYIVYIVDIYIAYTHIVYTQVFITPTATTSKFFSR